MDTQNSLCSVLALLRLPATATAQFIENDVKDLKQVVDRYCEPVEIDRIFSWMEEPCNCGNVFSHPDGGDAICRYCDGATEMRRYVESLRKTLSDALREVTTGEHVSRAYRCQEILEKALGDDEL